MQPLLQRKLEHGELDAEGQLTVGREIDGDEIKVLRREGCLAEVVEGGLREGPRCDKIVGAEKAGGGGREGGSGGGSGVEGEGDAGVLAEGLGGGGGEAAAMESSRGWERERGEGRERLGAAAVGVGEEAAVGMVESDGAVAELESAGRGGQELEAGGGVAIGGAGGGGGWEDAEIVEEERRRRRHLPTRPAAAAREGW